MGTSFTNIKSNKSYSQFKSSGRIRECFYCKQNKCIQSHSISQSHCLCNLVEEVNGEKGVYGFDTIKWNNAEWYNGYTLPGEFKLVGINTASTFSGFCATDDRTIFSLIDNKDFDPNSSEQCFLYCYRAFARAFHKKKEEQKSCISVSTFAVENPHYVSKRGCECHIGIDLDIADYPTLINEWKDSKGYDNLYHLHLEIKKSFPIASASVFEPPFDIMGQRINDYTVRIPLNHIFLNIIPEKQVTHILLSCFRSQEKSVQFINAIKIIYEQGDKDLLGTFLTTMLIFHTENTFFKPSLIENLSYCQKRNLILNLRNSITDGIQNYFINSKINGSLNLFEGLF